MAKWSLVVKSPDNQKHLHEMYLPAAYRKPGIKHLQQIAREAVTALGLTTTQRQPMEVPMRIYALELKGGNIVENYLGTFQAPVPKAKMTTEDYHKEMQELLTSIPDTFHPFVEKYAYSLGCGGGPEGVMTIAKDLVRQLKPYIERYRERLKQGAA